MDPSTTDEQTTVGVIESFTLASVSAEDQEKLAKREREVLQRYNALINDLTKEEELEVLGFSYGQLFPPIERDVEKLIIDLNIVAYQYMQRKMESSSEVRAETIRSTVTTALRKVSAALVVVTATDEKS